jgi:hypothetical protein
MVLAVSPRWEDFLNFSLLFFGLFGLDIGEYHKKDKQPADQQTLIEQLYQQIGQLTVECEFLKKSLRVAH